jgi:hypothetical protein
MTCGVERFGEIQLLKEVHSLVWLIHGKFKILDWRFMILDYENSNLQSTFYNLKS